MLAATVPPLPLVLGAVGLGSSLVLAALARFGRAVGAHPTASAYANKAPVEIGGETATIAFWGDVQRGIRDVASPLVEALSRDKAALVVHSGDLASHGEEPYYGIVARALDAAGLATPMLVVPGNHDLQPGGSRDGGPGRALFERAIGPRRWRTRVAGVLVLGLDDAIAPADAEDTAWLKAQLAAEPRAPYVLVCHKPPRRVDREGSPVLEGAAGLVALLEARPPLAVVSGHLRDDADATIAGVRYLVNVRGGDFPKKAWFAPKDFALVLGDVGPRGAIAFRRVSIPRRSSPRTAWHQFAVRMWAESRRGVGRFLAWPADRLFALFGWR